MNGMNCVDGYKARGQFDLRNWPNVITYSSLTYTRGRQELQFEPTVSIDKGRRILSRVCMIVLLLRWVAARMGDGEEEEW